MVGLLSAQPQNGLVGYWPFDGNADNEVDQTAAAEINATLSTDRFGIPNSAYDFNGSSNFIDVGSTFDSQERTVSLWVNPDAINGSGVFNHIAITQDDNALNYGILRVDFTSGTLKLWAGGLTGTYSTTAVTTGQWYHLVLVRNATQTKYYIDNVLVGTSSAEGTGSTSGPNPNLIIGAGRSKGLQFFNGRIDDIRIYNRELNATEVGELYNEQPYSTETEIVSFSLPGSSGNAIIDSVNHSIVVPFELGSDVTNLTPTFSLSTGAEAQVSGVTQQSGITSHNFSDPITYDVTAEDGTTIQSWQVSIYYQPVLTDQMILHFPLDGNGGDLSGNSNDGVLFGPIATNDRFGQPGGALSFDGVDDYVAISNYFMNGVSYPEYSISFWVKTASSASQRVASFDRSDYWRMEVNGSSAGDGQVGWNVFATAITNQSSTQRVDDNNWHHVVTVFNNGTMRLFVDGALESSATATGAIIGTANTRYGFLGVGSEATSFNGSKNTGSYFNGSLDDFRIYERALSETDVQFLHEENETNFLSFSFPGSHHTVIDDLNHTVVVEVPLNEDLTNLVGDFVLSPGATVKVGSTDQISGQTANDFSTPVNYTITSTDGQRSQNWTVTVVPVLLSTNELRAYWSMNGIASDQSGNGLDGAFYDNYTATTNRFGENSNAIEFVNGRFQVPDNELLDFGTDQDFSVSLWFNTYEDFSVPDPSRTFIRKTSGSVCTTDCFQVHVVPDSVIEFTISGVALTIDATPYDDNQWHHLVAVADRDATMQLYLDGQLRGSLAQVNNLNVTNAGILQVSENFLDGKFDDVRVFGRALSAPDVILLHEENENNILDFDLPGAHRTIIDDVNHTVKIEAPLDLDLTNLVADFVLSPGATARIASTDQASGVTSNDFSTPLTYTITSDDGLRSQDWTVSAYKVMISISQLRASLPLEGEATDYSGSGIKPKLKNTTAPTVDRFGQPGMAIDFVDGFINIPHRDTLNFGTDDDFSISLWFNTREDFSVADGTRTFIRKTNQGTCVTDCYQIHVLGTNEIEFLIPGTSLVIDASPYDDNQWHHMVAVADRSSKMELYMDGVLQGVLNQPNNGNVSNDLITRIGEGLAMEAAFDDLRIYSRVIDSLEVVQLFEEKETNFLTFEVPGSAGEALIDRENHRVELHFSSAIDLSNLVPSFTLSTNASASVGGVSQESGVTVQDFSSTLTYLIEGYDKSTSQAWSIVSIVDAPPNLQAGLQGDWPLDGNGTDVSGNNLTGTLVGPVADVDRHGITGGALSFDGTDDYIGIGDPAALQITGQISISAWIKPQDIAVSTGHQNVIAKGHSTTPAGEIQLRINSGRYESGSWDGIDHLTSKTVPLSDQNTWTHLVSIYDGSSWLLYRNGSLFSQTPDPTGAVAVAYGWAIGARGNGNNRFFNGSIDDVKIYDRPLIYSETQALYHGYSNETDFLSYSLPGSIAPAIIDTGNRTISIDFQETVDITSLVPTFTISNNAITTVNGVIQTSGVNAQDFSSPVTYQVIAEDLTLVDWTVTVNIKSVATDFLSYSLPGALNSANIDPVGHTISIDFQDAVDITNLAATFSLSPGAGATVSGVDQISGTTTHDFSTSIIYSVTAEDGITTQDWTVTVNQLAAGTEILSYVLQGSWGPAVIDSANHTVDLEFIRSNDLGSLTALFNLSPGASASISGIDQTSGVSVNDFNNPLTYLVTAEDGVNSQEWIVTVTQVSYCDVLAGLGFQCDEFDRMAMDSTVAGFGLNFTNDQIVVSQDGEVEEMINQRGSLIGGSNLTWTGNYLDFQGDSVGSEGLLWENLRLNFLGSNRFEGGLIWDEQSGLISLDPAASYFKEINRWGIHYTDPVPTDSKLAIGTSAVPSGYMLAVGGDVITSKIQADQISDGWPDYVFDKNYRLRSANALERYIKRHHHLPEVPSAKEVENEGVSLSEQDIRLLQKIEELTLYLIQQNNRIQFLKDRNNHISETIQQLITK